MLCLLIAFEIACAIRDTLNGKRTEELYRQRQEEHSVYLSNDPRIGDWKNPTAVKKDSCFETVLRSWNLIDASVQENLKNAARLLFRPSRIGTLISEVDNDDANNLFSGR